MSLWINNYPLGNNSKAPWLASSNKEIPFSELDTKIGECECCNIVADVYKKQCEKCLEPQHYEDDNG